MTGNIDGKRLLAIAICLSLLATVSSCNHFRPCFRLHGDLSEEPYGATDINAITGNQRLSVGINDEGTVTLLKWPNPSFYDQVKYMTTKRDAEDMGALPNEGILGGLRYKTDEGDGFVWLRDGVVEQKYSGPSSVVVETYFSFPDMGIEVVQYDFVYPDMDVLWRGYRVRRDEVSPVTNASVIMYANLAPQVAKITSMPLTDWCLDPYFCSTLEWDGEREAFIQFREGKDWSTEKHSTVYAAFGAENGGASYQAGMDRYSSPLSLSRDPFRTVQRKGLKGTEKAKGQVTAAVSRELDLSASSFAAFIMTFGKDRESSFRLMDDARSLGFKASREKTDAHWKDLLSDVPLPDTDDRRIKDMSLRSVIVLLLGTSRDTGAMVASISTQPPYGLDWPRDSAYFNEALFVAGFPEMVRKHNLFIASVQSTEENPIKRVPPGNWASNYYADGVPGFPLIWWEIDETGYAIWTLYRYYEETGDREYLEKVYPAIKRAANFLTGFRDPETGKPLPANENDDPEKDQSLQGSVTVYLGMKYAVLAAEKMGDAESEIKWKGRRDELERVIEERFYDPACGRYVGHEEEKGDCSASGAANQNSRILWPVELHPENSDLEKQTAKNAWSYVEKRMNSDRGAYEVLTLLSLAKTWKDDPEKLERVKEGLKWVSTVTATDTGHLGEFWLTLENGEVSPAEAQPQTWHHVLFYMTAMEAYGQE